ncbi:MAG TPA: cupredoxin domain-containing protein [Actinomycetes bacterium]|nr:cupredoxin domain-containing protein [Actinomycetes bacterium]
MIRPLLVGLLAATALAGCSKAPSTPTASAAGGPAQVSIVATSVGCAPSPATLPAGPMTFTVRNDGAPAVSEVELQQGGRMLGEKENLVPGLGGSFSLRLGQGTYTVYCPGAKAPRSSFVVTPS